MDMTEITEYYVFYIRQSDIVNYEQYPYLNLWDPSVVCKHADSFWLVPGTFVC